MAITKTKSLGTNYKPKSGKRRSGFDLRPVAISLLSLAIFFAALIFYRVFKSRELLFPISVMAVIAGLVYESKRYSAKWTTILYIALGAFVFSFFAFIPGKNEHQYALEDHVKQWPYVFIFAYAIIALVCFGDKVKPKLTEGITLLQSLAIIYWVIEARLFDTDYIALLVLMLLGLVFAVYALYNAFSYVPLSRSGRFRLSFWSSIVMMLLAVDNMLKVYSNGEIENYSDLSMAIYVGLQYFLLGISAMYILENIWMLIRFIPDKHHFFDQQYFKDLKVLKEEHIKRFSDEQIRIKDAVYVALFAITCFGTNFYFTIISSNMMIWLVFISSPYFVALIVRGSQTDSLQDGHIIREDE